MAVNCRHDTDADCSTANAEILFHDHDFANFSIIYYTRGSNLQPGYVAAVLSAVDEYHVIMEGPKSKNLKQAYIDLLNLSAKVLGDFITEHKMLSRTLRNVHHSNGEVSAGHYFKPSCQMPCCT